MSKTRHTFKARLWANTEKGGAWIAEYLFGTEEDFGGEYTAWKTSSAAKRWIKAKVQEKTPRKSVKLVAGTVTDEKGKPTTFEGELVFRA